MNIVKVLLKMPKIKVLDLSPSRLYKNGLRRLKGCVCVIGFLLYNKVLHEFYLTEEYSDILQYIWGMIRSIYIKFTTLEKKLM